MVAGPLVKEHGSKVGGYYTTVQTKPHKTNTLEQLRQKKTANLTGECKSANMLNPCTYNFCPYFSKTKNYCC